jgi:hypothetical protein
MLLLVLELYESLSVVAQSYEAEADNEYVIRGNSAVMKCEVPSFVADFVVVEMWLDSAGNTYLPGSDYGNECDCYSFSLCRPLPPHVAIHFL